MSVDGVLENKPKRKVNEYRHLDDGVTTIMYLKNGKEVLIDTEDYNRVKSLYWQENGRGYIYTRKKYTGEIIYLARYILGLDNSDENIVLHLNKDTRDNRKCNLKAMSKSLVAHYRRLTRNNKTGYKGVSYYKRLNKYVASIKVNGKYYFLGYFDTPEEAHAAYQQAVLKYLGEQAPNNVEQKV